MRWMLLAVVVLVLIGIGYYGIGLVEVAGVVREINLALLDGPFVPDEYVLIHSGFAIERMSPERAADALAFFGADL